MCLGLVLGLLAGFVRVGLLPGFVWEVMDWGRAAGAPRGNLSRGYLWGGQPGT